MRGGSSPKKGGQAAQALGRSRGGFSTKIHVSVDGLGNPLRFILTGGQQHDITQAEDLIAGYAGEHVLADKGYDAQEFRQHILELGMMPVIPPRSNRKAPADYDRHLYRERHLVECFINKIKHYRRIFSRFEKPDTWASCTSPPLSSGYGEMSTEPNAFLHARASRVEVRLDFEAERIRLSVSDDGVGLPDDYAERGRGFRGMRADAERLWGRLMVETGGRDGGTTVACEIPYG